MYVHVCMHNTLQWVRFPENGNFRAECTTNIRSIQRFFGWLITLLGKSSGCLSETLETLFRCHPYELSHSPFRRILGVNLTRFSLCFIAADFSLLLSSYLFAISFSLLFFLFFLPNCHRPPPPPRIHPLFLLFVFAFTLLWFLLHTLLIFFFSPNQQKQRTDNKNNNPLWLWLSGVLLPLPFHAPPEHLFCLSLSMPSAPTASVLHDSHFFARSSFVGDSDVDVFVICALRFSFVARWLLL